MKKKSKKSKVTKKDLVALLTPLTGKKPQKKFQGIIEMQTEESNGKYRKK